MTEFVEHNIAVLLTCHNRKNKTISALESLFRAMDFYNNDSNIINLTVYLTDDGSTDGTSEAVKESFSDREMTILKGDGNLFWAGGMRLAWNEALKKHDEWDFYLLINDDTDLLENTFFELLRTHEFCQNTYNKEGIYSGITSSKSDKTKMTYGGSIWVNKLLGTSKKLDPISEPQLCDMTNANILLISKYVVDKIGVFWDGYTHGMADYDYSIMARKKDIPVLITAEFCGRCDYDHKDMNELQSTILEMSLKERKLYFRHPLHSNKDSLKYVRRTTPVRYPFVLIGRFLNVYFPKAYYFISNIRNLSK